MKLKKILAILLCAAILFGTCGCNIIGFSKDDMLRPPKTMGDEAEIEQLISGAASDGYTLKYPKSGNYRSAIIMHDLDGDDVDEAIAFFRAKDGTTRIHILVMYEVESVWYVSDDFTNEATDIDCVDFADIDDGATQEILVGFTTFTTSVNLLTVYSYHRGKSSSIDAGVNYSSFYCGNLDNSGKSKVVTLSLVSAETGAKATMLEYDSKRNALFAKASVAMDGNVTGYKNVVFSDIGDGAKALYVDGLLPNDELNTQVIYYDKQLDVLNNPLYHEKSLNPTRRSNSKMICMDIGNDLKYEIPTVTDLPFNEELTNMTGAQQVVWNDFDVQTNELVPVLYTVANYNFAFIVKIPDLWLENEFTAMTDESGALTTFGAWNHDATVTKLFDMMVFKVSDWDQGKDNDGYTLIYKDNRYAYAFINYHPDSALALSDDEIKTAFSLLGKGNYNNSK